MSERSWAVWVWNGNGRRIRPIHIATDDPSRGHLVFATRLPATVADTSRALLQGVLDARQCRGQVTGGWYQAVEGWRVPYELDWPWPGDAVIVVDPEGMGTIFRLRRNGRWSARVVPSRELPDAGLLPHSFIGSWVYGALVRGEFTLTGTP